MKKNHFFGYIAIENLRKPAPNGRKTQRSQEPMYDIVGLGKTELGSNWNNETNSWEIEVRELDINFINLSERQLNLLTTPCEILINGGQVITYMKKIIYPRQVVGIFDPNGTDSVIDSEAIINTLLNKFDLNDIQILNALKALIPVERRTTFVRVTPNEWELKASNKQLANSTSGRSLDDYYQ